jgi:hypothetical protein
LIESIVAAAHDKRGEADGGQCESNRSHGALPENVGRQRANWQVRSVRENDR